MTDPQDPLPEGKWLYRRLFTWTLTLICCGLLWFIVQQLRGDVALVEVAKWLIGLIGILATFYLIAPSAEQLAKIVQAGRIFRATHESPPPPPPSLPRRTSRVDDPER
jgi:hypothetical protein